MEINKRCISAFSKTDPFVALATKSKLFDPTFSLTSELVLVDYISGKVYPAVTTELKFCKILWCEFGDCRYLVAGHENGVISVYERTENGLSLLKTKKCLEDDITALDFLVSKAVLVIGSAKGKIVFWTLSNMEKEYALDIPVSLNISSIAWNTKVSKILCVGSTDGVIKVLDIKKNSVIMTLSNRDFSEVRQLEWDPENNTKLNVISEKGYVTVFDLSNDSVSRVGDHNNSVIGFYRDVIVSKSLIEAGAAHIKINDSFECAISHRDPVVALSYVNGSTAIVSLPVTKKRVPFCLVSRYIYTPTARFEIKIKNRAEAPPTDPFYESLFEMLQGGSKLEDVAEHLLKSSSGFKPTSKGGIQVDTSDPRTLEYIHGNISNLKSDKTPLSLGILNSLFAKDPEDLKGLPDFKTVYVLSKLLNDFTALADVANPRILAALLIFNGIRDYSLLSRTRDGQILRAILVGDYGLYVDSKVPRSVPCLKRMKMIEALYEQVKRLAKDQPIKSARLSEYFWYKMFTEGSKSAEDMNVKDPDIKFYLEMQNADELGAKLKNTTVKTQPAPGQASAMRAPARVTPGAVPQGYPAPAAPAPVQQSFIPTASTATTSVSGGPTRPQYQSTPSPRSGYVPPQPRSPSIPTVPKGPYLGQNPPHQPQYASQAFPSPAQYSGQQFPAPQYSPPQPRYPPAQPQYQNPQAPYQTPQTPYQNPQTPYQTPQTQYQNPQTQYQNPQAFPSPPVQSPYGTPPAYRSPPTQSPYGSSPAQSPYGTPPSPIGQKVSIPQRLPPTPQFQQTGAAIPQPGMPKSPTFRDGPVPAPQGMPKPPSPMMEGAEEIVATFGDLVSEIRTKADANKSLILRQRKQQYLNALTAFDSLDKVRLPASILHVMDLVSKRVTSGGDGVKSDLDILIQGFNDVAWLKAAVELIKMVY